MIDKSDFSGNWFSISLEIPERSLQTFLEVVKGECRNMKLEQVAGPLTPAKGPRLRATPVRKFVTRRSRITGRGLYDTAAEMIKERLSTRGFTANDLSPLIGHHGFAHQSSYAVLDRLVKAEAVSVDRNGVVNVYRVVKGKSLDQPSA